MSLFACLVAALVALTGCAVQPAGTTTNENAAENRQYMAQLNQKTSELSDVLDEFQAAVSASDAVGMQAAAGKAAKIVDSVKAINPPESDDDTPSLAPVKELYVAGLEGLNDAMNQYVTLYDEVASGKINQAAFDRKLQAVQASYDAAVERIAAADEELTKLASE